jgi:hypothetical protein
LAARYLKSCQDAGQLTRAASVVDKLETRGESYWLGFARQTSATKTKLTRAGLDSGARMIMHGYLSTIVAMHVLRGVPLPDRVCDEGYFLDLCGRRPRDPQNRGRLGRLVHELTGADEPGQGTEPGAEPASAGGPAASEAREIDLTPADGTPAEPVDSVSGRAGP